ncbi:NAD(P)-binding protein [Massarina eburnea CBS 473.64]|uniref:NAD(P)-binding protein n=1 Tax=Massarina eburnea CBS 473.64 TaxID=1395130 RepID=A0A6A6RUL1_9PLEO|nr:NAD(P)-binding protein [Massarina eburnea CBS 473.64]
MASNGSIDPDMFTAPFQITKIRHRDVYGAIDPEKHASNAAGKVVLISGASGGLGFEVAKAWDEAGAKGIILIARDSVKLESAASELELASPTLLIPADITKEEDVQSVFSRAIAKLGTIDVVINTAGSMNVNGFIGEIAPSQWWKDYETNVFGTYKLAHYFITSTGGKGTFINLVSLGASFVAPGNSSYGSAKLASVRLGEFLHLEQPNLRVFSVYPGIVEATDKRGAVVDHFTPFAKDKPRLTAAFTLWLLGEQAEFLRGGFVSVNWDVEEMKKHKQEIVENNLLKLGFIGAKLGPEGHPWGQ